MCAGCGSRPSTGSSYAVPGAAMSRSPRASTPGRNRSDADQPVRLGRGLPAQPLLEARGEHVGDRLVERARLALVGQPGRVLGQRVRELVADHVDGLGEPVEDLAVAVAEHQLGAVPERVDVALLVVHGRDARWRPRRRTTSARRPRRASRARPRRRTPPRRRPGHRTRAPPRGAPPRPGGRARSRRCAPPRPDRRRPPPDGPAHPATHAAAAAPRRGRGSSPAARPRRACCRASSRSR